MRSEFRKLVLTVAVAAGMPLSAGAVCNAGNIAGDAPDSRFMVLGDTVTDAYTGLMWKRCSEGLEGAGCTGTAVAATWQEALARVATANSQSGGSFTDWRLPNRNELASLVETKCVNPAINETIFPGTPSQTFWTSSPYARNASMAWAVDFNSGNVTPLPKANARSIRLVRGGR